MTADAAARRSGLFRRGALLLALGLLAVPWLLPEDNPAPPLVPAPRLEVGELALTGSPDRLDPAAPPGALPAGGRAWLHLEALEPAELHVLQLPARGQPGWGRPEALEAAGLATLRPGAQALALDLPAEGAVATYLLLVTGERLSAERALELAAGLRLSGPWLRPALLRELRAEGVADPVARVYGLSAALAPAGAGESGGD